VNPDNVGAVGGVGGVGPDAGQYPRRFFMQMGINDILIYRDMENIRFSPNTIEIVDKDVKEIRDYIVSHLHYCHRTATEARVVLHFIHSYNPNFTSLVIYHSQTVLDIVNEIADAESLFVDTLQQKIVLFNN
jgi:hypothetical protein